MDAFTEEHIKFFLSEEWLVKVDGHKSVPYLFKFHHSSMDLSCVVLVTDTKSVWVEVLSSQQFARRWRSCNPDSPPPFHDQGEEDAWRESSLELLSNSHTLGAIPDIQFEVVESDFSDFAFELESEHFKWRWETNSVGYRMSAEIISKQLILPLICANHISVSSSDALSGMSDPEVEKAIDKVGRTARRATDNHVKIALTKPRVATMLRRITALFNFVPNLPPIFSTAEKPDLKPKPVESSPPIQRQENSRPNASAKKAPASAPEPTPSDGGSTEDESDVEQTLPAKPADQGEDAVMRDPSPPPSRASPIETPAVDSDSDSRPKASKSAAAHKKARVASSTDDDSDAKPSQPVVKRGGGARQPIKRGGKRF
ncbi:hypothetical protein DFP72DRAFT_892149 [Ephemerocybe angulata]|uniref:XLF-like N-terminal domain-containing protein n=1 Tax=Ephemerocybe angulata TaxID=980116 RepID=A0A8H6I3F6_9AGAR|nr:hypothetical protein DFP72DRAFT_892149 [Tulosesus angulatus]